MNLSHIIRSILAFGATGSLLLGCGQDSSARKSSSAQLSSGSLASQEALTASYSEAMDALSDSNLTANSSTSLMLSAPINTQDFQKSCQASGDKALVSISGQRSISFDRSNARVSIEGSRTMTQKLERIWSKSGSSVACNANGKGAAIDFEADISGYQLEVSIDRSASRSLKVSNLKKGTSTTASAETSMKGSRSISWLSQSVAADGAITREKSISFSVTRSSQVLDKDGSSSSLSQIVKTVDGAPLVVSSTWDSLGKNRQLLAKTIKQGKLHVQSASGSSYMEASFDSMALSFSSSECSIKSGSMTASIYESEGASASTIYKLSAIDGVISVQNITDAENPIDVDDFDYTPCDLKDFNY